MQHTRSVRRRLVFEGTVNATLNGFATMWTVPAVQDVSQVGEMFADDAFVRKEYVEIYDLIRTAFDEEKNRVALVRGSSGIGKSAFLQYLVARIRNQVSDVLVVRGQSFDSKRLTYLHLSTNWFGWKTATRVPTFEEALVLEKKCSWTIVDGCDWEPTGNFTVGAASPSTPWKGFRKVRTLVQLCMPAWPLSQLEKCAESSGRLIELPAIRENYELIGGIARWALGGTTNVLEQVDSAVREINFDTIQQVMATQHATKTDEKELVHRLVLWRTPVDEDGHWMYQVTAQNPIRYSLLSRFVSKELAEKAATLSIQKRKMLISELKGESAASAYRGVIFEADAIDRLVCGGTFQLRKCTAAQGTPQEVPLTLSNTQKRYAIPDLDNLGVLTAIDHIVVPDARNFESVDAFCVSSSPIFQRDPGNAPTAHYETLQFQMTVGKSHPTKFKGVKQVLEKVRKDLPNTKVTCAVVYVVPDDVQALYEAPQSVLKNDGKVRVHRDDDFSDRNQYRLVIDYSTN